MLPSEYKKKKREANRKPKVHQKIANTFIENAISKSNISALKTLYYLSTILTKVDMENMKDNKIIGIKMDKREMLKFTDLSIQTLVKTTKQMQQTSITFYDDDGGIEGMSLLPRYHFVPNKNIVEIDLYVRIARMIIDVKNKYTPMNIKDLMHVKSKHSLRFLALLARIKNYDEDVPKRKKMTLENLNEFFGVNYKKWSMLEKTILKPIKEELDLNAKLSFIYESNYENLGRGRPSFRDVTIDLIDNNGNLFTI